MTQVLSAQPDPMRGVVRVQGIGIPAGDALITRQVNRLPEPIRGGDLTGLLTGGFVEEDPEPPFGVDLTYRVTVTPAVRHIQTNRVLNPKVAVNTNNWLTGINRALTRDAAPTPAIPRDALTALSASTNPGGTALKTLDDRLLASTVPLDMAPGRWFVTGQVKYDSPDTWLWMDALAAGTWSDVLARGTWQAVRSIEPLEATEPFASVWAAVISAAQTAAERRRNRIPNPRGATAATGWTVNPGTGGTAAVTQVATGGPDGGSFVRATWSVASTAVNSGQLRYDGRAAQPLPMPVTPGTTYSCRMDVRASLAQRLALVIVYFDAAGIQVGASAAGPAAVLVANTWTELRLDNTTAPAGAAYAIIGPQAVSGTGAVVWPVGATLEASRAILETGATAGAYFSGASTATAQLTYAWAGTANASQSIESVLDYTTHVAPFQLIGVSVFGQGQWRTFQAWLDIPAGMPAGSRLAFLHGTADREFGTTFWLTTLLVTPEAEIGPGTVLPYFDGDSVPPTNPAANLAPGYDWFTVSTDATMVWSGTPNGSSSVFTGPSVIAAETATRIDAPGPDLLPRHKLPVHLSDPILPPANVWFELVEIGDLGFAARQELYDIIGRGAQIAVSSQRAWASGQFRLATFTLEAASIAERMFAPGRILFLRNPDPRFPESVWYLAIGNVTQGRVGPNAAFTPERLWQVPFVRVERPVGLIAAATGVNWNDIKTSFTWDDLRKSREDWLDVAVTPT